MEFRVLGPIAAHAGGPIALGGPLQQSVLAILIAARGQPVTADALTSEIWGDSADHRAAASLYTYISNLRGLVGKDHIVRDAHGYRFVLAHLDTVDAIEFESQVVTARQLAASQPGEASDRYGEALCHWRGRPYEGLEDLAVLAPEIVRLDELHAEAEVGRFELELRAGGCPPIGEIEGLCRRRPYDERPWGLLMRSQFRGGRQAEALRTYARVRASFGDELGIEPSPMLQRLEEQILLHDPALDATQPGTAPTLPVYLTTFVGRAAEQHQLSALLDTHRVVTITGPGGAGKTRLAVEVATSTATRYPDGVSLADLAKLTDPDRLGSTIAAAMGLPSTAADQAYTRLIQAHHAYEELLVLDNCEHLHAEAGRAALDLLEGIPGLAILATSRVPLGCEGETRFALSGLSVGSTDRDHLGDAERLFIERSSRVVNSEGGQTSSAAISELCQRLDGMPLALELAAGRTDALSEREISDLLDQRFAVLVDEGRSRDIHRSLAATIGWSYGLLQPDDRRALATLGAFAGPFTAPAAAAVIGCDGEHEAINTLDRLVNASLVTVQRRVDQPTTFRLLETIRAYAIERLVESGDEIAAVRRHDDHYVDVCRNIGHEFYGAERVAATTGIGAELSEYVAAWDRSVAVDGRTALTLAWPVGNYWLFGADLPDGAERLRALIDQTRGDTSPARAEALVVAGWIVVAQNDMELARRWTTEAIDIHRRTGDSERLAYALARGGHWAFAEGDFESAMALLTESLEMCDRIAYEDGNVWPTTLIAQARRWSGDDDPKIRDLLLWARRRFIEIGETYGQTHVNMLLGTFDEFDPEVRAEFATEMLELGRRQGGDNTILPIALHNLAYPTWSMGQFERAWGINQLAIRAAVASGMEMNLGLALIQIATFEGERGDPERAAVMFGAGMAHFGMQLAPFQLVTMGPSRETSAAALGQARFDELHRIGAAMSADEAAGYALRNESGPFTTRPTPTDRPPTSC